jgi:fructose-bisphosphate aldolase class II
MKNVRDVLEEADRTGIGIGHYNISDLIGLEAVAGAAREVGVPVIVGLSEGERKFMGTRVAALLVKYVREEHSQPIYLNADHTHSLESAIDAAKAGFDSIVFDRSELPLQQNIRETKKAVEVLKSINPSIMIEGEIGYIGSGSEIHDKALGNVVLSTRTRHENLCRRREWMCSLQPSETRMAY